MFVSVVIVTGLKALRPMSHFQDAVDFLLKEFPLVCNVYLTDVEYQLATVLHPEYGPKWFADHGEGNTSLMYCNTSLTTLFKTVLAFS